PHLRNAPVLASSLATLLFSALPLHAAFIQIAEPDNGTTNASVLDNYSSTDYFDVAQGGSASVDALSQAGRFTNFGYDSQPNDAIGATTSAQEPGRFLFSDVGFGATEILDLFQATPGLPVQSVRIVVGPDGAFSPNG